jgi:hypothetical protein
MPEKNKKSVTKRIKSKTTKNQLFGAFPWAWVSPVKSSGKTTTIKRYNNKEKTTILFGLLA